MFRASGCLSECKNLFNHQKFGPHPFPSLVGARPAEHMTAVPSSTLGTWGTSKPVLRRNQIQFSWKKELAQFLHRFKTCRLLSPVRVRLSVAERLRCGNYKNKSFNKSFFFFHPNTHSWTQPWNSAHLDSRILLFHHLHPQSDAGDLGGLESHLRLQIFFFFGGGGGLWEEPGE